MPQKSKANYDLGTHGKNPCHWSPQLPAELTSHFSLTQQLVPTAHLFLGRLQSLCFWRSSLRQGAQLTLSKLGSASPSFIHLCLQICSIERRLFGSNTSMWRIKCSHSATDRQPVFSLAGEALEASAAGGFSGTLLLVMSLLP